MEKDYNAARCTAGRKQRQWRCTNQRDILFRKENIPFNPKRKDEGLPLDPAH